MQLSFDGKLCQKCWYQKLLKSDNCFSSYRRKCRGCFLGHSVDHWVRDAWRVRRPALARVYFEYICWKFARRLLDRVNTPLRLSFQPQSVAALWPLVPNYTVRWIETYACKQLAQRRYLAKHRARVEPANLPSPVRHATVRPASHNLKGRANEALSRKPEKPRVVRCP